MSKIDAFRNYKHWTDAELCRNCGLTPASIIRARKDGNDVSVHSLHKVLANYPEINPSWLYSGEGEMIREDYQSSAVNISDSMKVPKNIMAQQPSIPTSTDIYNLAQSFAQTVAKLTDVQAKMQDMNTKLINMLDERTRP